MALETPTMNEQLVDDFLQQAGDRSSNSVTILFQSAIKELDALKEALTVAASPDKPSQPREKVEQYIRSRAQVIDREMSKCAVIFGSSGNAIDYNSIQHAVEGVLEPSRQIVAATQLYLRYFGEPMKTAVTRALKDILEASKGSLSQCVMEHWEKLKDSTSSVEDLSLTVSPLQKQLIGRMRELFERVSKLPRCDSEALQSSVKKVRNKGLDALH
eukprot:gb/GECG01014892.1/.p1 GENE.gb/GECG01014892.1/~~gb/GECG01014892.1/.p1  ORF type:complete len:215 (+),score=26.65 gb/GECG01014892.1/:1-645(+)